MAHNVCINPVVGIGGLKNKAQRNIKPDHLRKRSALANEFKKLILIASREPRNCINILLAVVTVLHTYSSSLATDGSLRIECLGTYSFRRDRVGFVIAALTD
jgi:hypothetical protein